MHNNDKNKNNYIFIKYNNKMNRPSPKERLLSWIEKSNEKNGILDVSRIRADGTGVRMRILPSFSFHPTRSNKFIIDNIPIVSNTYESYKTTMNILGSGYEYLADYYLIILEIKKGDREYIKEIVEINFPALVSNRDVFNFALAILGPDYDYLNDYYDLAIAIRDSDDDEVHFILDKFDPRDDNYFTYHIAKQYGNQEYIKLVEDEVVRRDWLERQALENVLGTNSPYKELHQYIRKMQ